MTLPVGEQLLKQMGDDRILLCDAEWEFDDDRIGSV
jgi:hypothetical protein